MTSDNPFENNGALKTAAADDQLSPPPLEVEIETDEVESVTAPARNGATQKQPPADENDVDDDLPGETPSENDEDDAVDAEVVDDDADSDDTETSTELAQWVEPEFPSREPNWEHDTIEFKGFALNVRIPTSQALTGFSMATGEYISPQIKQAMVSKFVNLHFSPQSYAFLMMRLMNPNATDFDEDTFGEIVKILVEKAGERVVAAAEAKAALEKKNSRKRRKR